MAGCPLMKGGVFGRVSRVAFSMIFSLRMPPVMGKLSSSVWDLAESRMVASMGGAMA